MKKIFTLAMMMAMTITANAARPWTLAAKGTQE